MNDTYIIPNVGSKGKFTFKAPFDLEVYSNQEFTVTAVRSYKEVADSNIDIYKVVYEPVGLTEVDFLKDSQNNVPLVILINTAGKYINIPANRISALPDTSGTKYQEVVLAVNVGLLPLGYDLETTKDVLLDCIHDTLGVESTVQEVKSSGIIIIDQLQHDTYMKLLANKRNINLSFRTRYNKLKDQYDRLDKLYKDLEAYVIAKGIK